MFLPSWIVCGISEFAEWIQLWLWGPFRWSLLILLIFQMPFAYVFSLVELLRLLTSVVIRLLIFDSRHASALAELSLLIWARPISICMLMYASCLRLEHQCYVPFPVRPVPWGGTRQPSSYYCGVGCFGGRVIHPVCGYPSSISSTVAFRKPCRMRTSLNHFSWSCNIC